MAISNKFLLILCVLLLSIFSCEKENQKPKTVPSVKTGEATGITSNSAILSGEVTSDGKGSVTERGFTLGQAANPDLSGTRVTAGAGTGAFTASLTQLASGATYHVRAYAVNQVGVGYGEDRIFSTTILVPTVSTTAVGSITITTVSAGGTVTADGGSSITARGICWNTTGNPVISDNKTTDGTGTGAFASAITGLNSNTKIYIRAYASNAAGTGYGQQLEATSKSLVPLSGLIAFWPFNGNANDASGNNNSGTVVNAQLTADRFNTSNKAYSFNGTDAFIKIPTLNGISYSPISYSAWAYLKVYIPEGIYPAGIGQVIVGREAAGYTDQGCLMMGKNQMIIDNTFYYYRGQDGVDSQFKPDLNRWYHVVLTISDGTYKYYVDGTLVRTAQSITSEFQNIPFLIGAGSGSNLVGNRFFYNGLIDDVAIWNRALTADEVLKVYNGTGF